MDPITIVAAVVALGAGYGYSNYNTKKKLGSAEEEAKKELALEMKKNGEQAVYELGIVGFDDKLAGR